MDDKRQKFIRVQLLTLKAKTIAVLRKVKEERFTIEDEQKELARRFINDEEDDMAMLMTVTVRQKIHAISYKALQDIRDWKIPNIDRLPRLVNIHLNQLKKMNAVHYDINKKFYTEMLDSIQQNKKWLEILKSSHI
tara:strand:+ start:908 stop:1315 length:408 start_codon:yes stop_codon:yes gene_type:complete